MKKKSVLDPKPVPFDHLIITQNIEKQLKFKIFFTLFMNANL